MITINLNKAKEIKKDMLREERKPLLEALDIEMMKNWANQEKLADIDSKKQALRDATKVVDTAESVEELKTITLPALE